MGQKIVYWATRDEMLGDLRSPRTKRTVELGADKGDFSATIIRTMIPRHHSIVDTWATERYNSKKFEYVKNRFASELDSGQLSILRLDSIEAAKEFDDETIDFLYIDTDHRYRHTLDEIRAWAPKISRHGILAGDDFAVGNPKVGMEYGVITAVFDFLKENRNWQLLGLALESGSEKRNFSFALTRTRF